MMKRIEYPDMSSLKRYTEKKYRDLTTQEKESLIKTLLNDDEYLKYKNCYIAKTKLLYDSSETLIKETAALSRLNDLGYVVYLLPYAYARDNMNFFQKSADSITAGDFLEMKSVVTTGPRAGQSAFESARHQANNIYLSIVNDVPEQKILNNIYGSIGQIKKENKKNGVTESFEGKLIINFEKSNEISLYMISEEGRVNKIEKPDFNSFKKIKGTVYDSSQVLKNPMTEHGSSCDSNISQTSEMSSESKNNKEYNPLTDYTKIEVNGKERECRNGVLEGFKNAVRQLDSVIETNHELCDENNRLVMENMRLKEQLNKRNHNKEHERG